MALEELTNRSGCRREVRRPVRITYGEPTGTEMDRHRRRKRIESNVRVIELIAAPVILSYDRTLIEGNDAQRTDESACGAQFSRVLPKQRISTRAVHPHH